MKNSETFSNSSTFFILMGIDLIMFAFVLFQDVIIMESLFYLTLIFWVLLIGAIVSLFREGELF
mgnify:CR=1 FL=1|tara:strand:- start:922 stop:1113 length:192 start_codon:yes stop_codon:yes gene_type:complete